MKCAYFHSKAISIWKKSRSSRWEGSTSSYTNPAQYGKANSPVVTVTKRRRVSAIVWRWVISSISWCFFIAAIKSFKHSLKGFCLLEIPCFSTHKKTINYLFIIYCIYFLVSIIYFLRNRPGKGENWTGVSAENVWLQRSSREKQKLSLQEWRDSPLLLLVDLLSCLRITILIGYSMISLSRWLRVKYLKATGKTGIFLKTSNALMSSSNETGRTGRYPKVSVGSQIFRSFV